MSVVHVPTAEDEHSGLVKLLSAGFYALCSFLLIFVNKTILTNYRFPSYMFVGIGQMASTILILYTAKKNNVINFPDLNRSVLYKIFPLPLLYVGNHITGLAGTKKLSLPMFTVLRKFTILITMIVEIKMLRKTFPYRVVCSVCAIVVGAVMAASTDLAFDAEGYVFVFLNNLFTATSTVATKKKLGSEALGKYGLMFYNALTIIVPTILLSFFTGDLQKAFKFEDWRNYTFVFYFMVSCVMGFVLMFSTILCSHYNSALTTTIVGATKNVGVAYIGMFVGGDYVFSWLNFIGLNICMSGGLLYSYFTFRSGGALDRDASKTPEPLGKHGLKDHHKAEGPLVL